MLPFGAVVLAGLLVGIELSVAAFIHPQIAHLEEAAHRQARQRFARLFGVLMPPWYAATALCTLAVAWREGPLSAAACSALLWIASIVFTLLGPFPINKRICAWNLADPPPDWQRDCAAWDRLHRVRVGLLLAAFVCLLQACLRPGP